MEHHHSRLISQVAVRQPGDGTWQEAGKPGYNAVAGYPVIVII